MAVLKGERRWPAGATAQEGKTGKHVGPGDYAVIGDAGALVMAHDHRGLAIAQRQAGIARKGCRSWTDLSSLLPADYCQRGLPFTSSGEPNGVHLETRYSVGLQGFTSKGRTSEPNRKRPSWENAGRLKTKNNRVYDAHSSPSKTPRFRDLAPDELRMEYIWSTRLR